jgi:hypothetical protein
LTSTDATEEYGREREGAATPSEREREMEWYWHLSHLIWSLTYWLTVTWGSQVCCTRHIASLHEDQTWPPAVEEIAQKCDLA